MIVICDIEANGLLDTVDKVWCVVTKDVQTGKVYKFGPDQLQEACLHLDKCDIVIGHNFIDYDAPVLNKVLGYTFKEDCVIIDTFLLSQMLTPDRQKHPRTSARKGAHSLENFGNIFKRYKPEHEDWTQFSPEMLHRCEEDVEINYMAYMMLNRQAQLVSKEGALVKDAIWSLPYKIEARFAALLVQQKRHGFLLNRRRVEGYIKYLTKKIDAVDREVVPQLPIQLIIEEAKDAEGTYKYKKPFKGNGELNQYTVEWCGRVGITDTTIISGPFSRVRFTPFDLGSTQLVKAYLLDQGWVPEEWNTKKDALTDKIKRTSPKLSQSDAFLGVEGEVGQKVATRLIYRHRRSQLEGFLKYVRQDGRISADASGITPTCRLKHTKVVNIPGGDAVFGTQMRRAFTVPKGYKLVGCDAASCQLRDLCHHMGDEEYTTAVISGSSELGTDVHSLTMKLTGLPHRTAAKRFVYGSLFGAGLPKLAAMMEVPVKVAKTAKARFFEALPLYADLVGKLERAFNSKGYITGADGRPIYPRSAHQALCYQLQSDEAIGMKVAYIYLCNWIKKEGLDAQIVCFMHDEINTEVREDHAERVAELSELAIKKAHEWLGFTVPFSGKAAIGKNWMEVH